MANNEMNRNDSRSRRRILRHTDDGHLNFKILNFLIYNATKQQTLGLKRLMVEVGIEELEPNDFARMDVALGELFDWCHLNKWPMMTSLVVLQSGSGKGLPGKGFWEKAQTLEHEVRFSLDKPLIELPRDLQAIYIGWQQQMCFSHFASLSPKKTEEVTLEDTDTGYQPRVALKPYDDERSHLNYQMVYQWVSKEMPGFDQLDNEECDALMGYLLKHDKEVYLTMIDQIKADDNYRNGKQARAIRTFMRHHGLVTS